MSFPAVAASLALLAISCRVNKNDAVSGSWEAKWDCKPWLAEGQPGCKSACDSGGLSEACAHHGKYGQGLGPAGRLAYLQRGCVGGTAAELDACVALASMHAQGQGTPRDLTRVHTLVDRLCSSGDECRCNQLAHLYAEPSMHDDAEYAGHAFVAWCAGACEMEAKASICGRLSSKADASLPR